MVVHAEHTAFTAEAVVNEELVAVILDFDTLTFFTFKVRRKFCLIIVERVILLCILYFVLLSSFSEVMWQRLAGITGECLVMRYSTHHGTAETHEYSKRMLFHQFHSLIFKSG